MAIDFPDKLELSNTPTPLQCLTRLSAFIGGPRIWIKRDDLTECALSGNKIRKLEYVLAQAQRQGCDTLITSGGIQSNHCRATALVGARLGMAVHLLLRDEGLYTEAPRGNLMLDYLAGATITIVPAERYRREHSQMLKKINQHYLSLGKKPWVLPVGASDGHGVWGYVNCARELKEDFHRAAIKPEKLFHATGSGGTQAGLSAGAKLYGLPCEIIGMAVCDDSAYFQKKVAADLRHWVESYHLDIDPAEIPIVVNDRYIGPGYAQAGEEVFSTIKLVAKLEGIVLDPVYTGKAFHGMLEELRQGRLEHCRDIIFVHTGGIFGLLAQNESLGFKRPKAAEREF